MTSTSSEARSIVHRRVFDPFSEKDGLPIFKEYSAANMRVIEGYFGPVASHHRSLMMERSFEGTQASSLVRIRDKIEKYKRLFVDNEGKGQKKVRVIRDTETEEGNKKKKEIDVPWTKELEIDQLKKEWEKIPKGGYEELRWTEKAVALTAAGFEEHQRTTKNIDFQLRDNQLYYMTLLLLNKGNYDFGNLETDSRGVQLPTGEGKTFGFGLAAPIMAMRGETVHVIEPNYVSTSNHARQMAGFYDDFFRIQTGVITSIPEQKGRVRKNVITSTGEIKTITEGVGATKSFIYMNGKLSQDMGHSGRERAWNQKIVYTDTESVAFDYLSDHQIGVTEKSGQPDLGKVTALVAEADQQMIDDARNPFIISEVAKTGDTWDRITTMLGLDKCYTGLGWTDDAKREQTQKILFTFWANLFEKKREGFFKEGEEKDYIVSGREHKLSSRGESKAVEITIDALKDLFGYSEEMEEQALLRNMRNVLHNFPSLDLLEKGQLENVVANIRGAYRFHNNKYEVQMKKYEKILLNSREKSVSRPLLTARIQQGIEELIKKDHQEVMWKGVRLLTDARSDLNQKEKAQALEVFSSERRVVDGESQPSNREVMEELLDWFMNSPDFIKGASEVLFGMRESADFISGKKPVLLDDYGFPLEKRHLHDTQQIFLQMQNIWLQAGMDKKKLTPELIGAMIDAHGSDLEISQSTDRLTTPVLFKKYGKLRFSSGSLIPASLSFRDLYDAEVLGVSRHMPLPEVDYTHKEKKKSILTRCLDGGVAEVRFMSEARRYVEIKMKADEIKRSGRTGLFIVPDIEYAQKLIKFLPDAELATGAEELHERGTLDKVTSDGVPGKVIITTWIAHRDIDVKLAPEAGGLDCVVLGLLPTERGLWQALQRSLRGDQLGTRTLMLTPEDFSPLENIHLIEGARPSFRIRNPQVFHRHTVERIHKEWDGALKNDKESMERLFTEYLDYLQVQEQQMKTQLLHTYIRDQHLEKWKSLYLERQKRIVESFPYHLRIAKELDQKIQENRQETAAQESTLIGYPPQLTDVPLPANLTRTASGNLIIPTPPQRQTSINQTKQEEPLTRVLQRLDLYSQAVPELTEEYIRLNDLRYGWVDFLDFIEFDFAMFLRESQNLNLDYDKKRDIYGRRIFEMFKEGRLVTGDFPGDVYVSPAT